MTIWSDTAAPSECVSGGERSLRPGRQVPPSYLSGRKHRTAVTRSTNLRGLRFVGDYRDEKRLHNRFDGRRARHRAEPFRRSSRKRAETAAAAKPTKQVIGDWVVSCAPAANGHNACVMSQTLASQKLKKTISVLSIGRDRTGKLTGSLRMPIGVRFRPALWSVSKTETHSTFPIPPAIVWGALHRSM